VVHVVQASSGIVGSVSGHQSITIRRNFRGCT